jgi:peptidyl-prolyl cis-trans isomerase SurA
MKHLKKNILFIVIVNSFLIFAPSKAAEPLNHIVAVVNASVITEQQLDEQVELTRQQELAANKAPPAQAKLRKQALDSLIDIELQRQLAESSGIKVDDALVDHTIGEIAQRNGLTVDQLQSRLEEGNMPFAKYRQKIHEQLVLSRLQQKEVGQKITVSDQEIKDMVAQMPKSNAEKATYHVVDLTLQLPDNPSPKALTDAKQIALSLVKKAKKGITFQALVEQSQNIPYSLAIEDLGWRPLHDLPDIFQKPVESLNQGEIAGPLHAQNGYHVIHLLEVKGNETIKPHYVTATHARHILIKTSPLVTDVQAEQRLKELRAEVLRGGDFGTLAKKYSQDPASSIKGGDLGWTLPGLFDPVFEAQLTKLTTNQISLPFHTQFGWHIAQVLGRTEKLQTKQIISQHLASQLVYQKKYHKALESWLRQLRSQSYVKKL